MDRGVDGIESGTVNVIVFEMVECVIMRSGE